MPYSWRARRPSFFQHALALAAIALSLAGSGVAASAAPSVKLHLSATIVTRDDHGRVVEVPAASKRLEAGDRVRYDLTAFNAGDSPALRLTPREDIPAGLRIVQASVSGPDAHVEYSLDGKTWSSAPTIVVGSKSVPAPSALYRAIRWVTAAPLAPQAHFSYSFEAQL